MQISHHEPPVNKGFLKHLQLASVSKTDAKVPKFEIIHLSF